MHRILPISVILNWLAVLAVLGFAGFGFDGQSSGIVGSLTTLLSSNGPYFLPLHLAHATSIFIAMVIFTAGIWALLAVAFADARGTEKDDQDFVTTLAFGSCLFIFTLLAGYAVFLGESSLGAQVSVASFATILAGVANRVFSVEAVERFETNPLESNQAPRTRATSMATQSAKLATMGSGSTRFVPKPRFPSHTRHSK